MIYASLEGVRLAFCDYSKSHVSQSVTDDILQPSADTGRANVPV